MQQHTNYSINRLNTLISSSDISKYRALRLEALSTDPSAFSSNYSREQAFTERQWRDRIEGDDRAILIASLEGDSNNSYGGRFSPGKKDGRIHAMMGMWIHPEHRRRGLATRLIRAATEIAAGDALIVAVAKHNTEGLALHKKLGFVQSSMGAGDDNEIWLIKEVDGKL